MERLGETRDRSNAAEHDGPPKRTRERESRMQDAFGNRGVLQLLRARQSSRSVEETLSGPGQSIDPATRQWLGKRVEGDFSSVRVHRGSAAAAAANDLGGAAFAVGEHVVLGEHDPKTPLGRAVLAHELAHVAQQRRGGSRDSTPAAETEARDASRAAARGGRISPAAGAAPGPALMTRDEVDRIRNFLVRDLQRSVYDNDIRFWEVYCIIEVYDRSGTFVDRSTGRFRGGDADHAEREATELLDLGGVDVNGGDVFVSVNQNPCGEGSANCRTHLHEWAAQRNMTLHIDVPAFVDPARGGSPRTAARSNEPIQPQAFNAAPGGQVRAAGGTPGYAPRALTMTVDPSTMTTADIDFEINAIRRWQMAHPATTAQGPDLFPVLRRLEGELRARNFSMRQGRLPASQHAWHGGIQPMMLMRGTLPLLPSVEEGHVTGGGYRLVPQIEQENLNNPHVVYYVAMDVEHHRFEYAVAPDSVDEFMAETAQWHAHMAFMLHGLNELPQWQIDILRGEYGASWGHAVQDPGWIASAVVATAGAAGGLSAPLRGAAGAEGGALATGGGEVAASETGAVATSRAGAVGAAEVGASELTRVRVDVGPPQTPVRVDVSPPAAPAVVEVPAQAPAATLPPRRAGR